MREGIKIEKAYLNISVYDAFVMRMDFIFSEFDNIYICLLYTSPSPRDS